VDAKKFSRYLNRDGGCVHCGDIETAVPHHRANRGMGGSKIRDVPSNIIVICAYMNGQMESNSVTAAYAKRHGWKLESWEDPKSVQVWYATKRAWITLDDNFGLSFEER